MGEFPSVSARRCGLDPYLPQSAKNHVDLRCSPPELSASAGASGGGPRREPPRLRMESRRRNSICAFRLRRSSRAQRLSCSHRSGGIRSSRAFFSAMIRSPITGAKTVDRGGSCPPRSFRVRDSAAGPRPAFAATHRRHPMSGRPLPAAAARAAAPNHATITCRASRC